jgi:polyhydroxybutyrate depolymerase
MKRLIAIAALTACSAPAKPAPPPPAPPREPSPLVTARPFDLHVPPHYDPARPTPLVISLHGYTSTGADTAGYFRIGEVADRETFLLASPDGTRDDVGNAFWNATDACCNFADKPVDDVAYVNAVIDDVERRYNVDPKRIYLVGHSNGGFMSHRLACELAPRIAAIVSVAGAQWNDPARCKPAAKVAVVQVHGDADEVIAYQGGRFDRELIEPFAKAVGLALPPFTPGERVYPSARQTVATWAKLDGCTETLDRGTTLDLDSSVPGAETTIERYRGCSAGLDVELWTVAHGSHGPAFAEAPAEPAFAAAVYAFFAAHPKP